MQAACTLSLPGEVWCVALSNDSMGMRIACGGATTNTTAHVQGEGERDHTHDGHFLQVFSLQQHWPSWRLTGTGTGRVPAPGTPQSQGQGQQRQQQNGHCADLAALHTSTVNAVVFDPCNADILLSGSIDGTVVACTVSTAQPCFTLEQHAAHAQCVEAIRFSHRGRHFATGGGSSVYVFQYGVKHVVSPSVMNAQPVECACLRHHDGDISCLAWSACDQFLASGSDDGTAIVYRLAEPPQAPQGQTHRAMTTGGGQCCMFEVCHRVVCDSARRGSIYGLDFSPTNVLATSSVDGIVSLWGRRGKDAPPYSCSRTVTHSPSAVNAVRFSSRAQHLVTVSDNGSALVLCAATLAVLAEQAGSTSTGSGTGTGTDTVIGRGRGRGSGTGIPFIDSKGQTSSDMTGWHSTSFSPAEQTTAPSLNALAYARNGTMYATGSDGNTAVLYYGDACVSADGYGGYGMHGSSFVCIHSVANWAKWSCGCRCLARRFMRVVHVRVRVRVRVRVHARVCVRGCAVAASNTPVVLQWVTMQHRCRPAE